MISMRVVAGVAIAAVLLGCCTICQSAPPATEHRESSHAETESATTEHGETAGHGEGGLDPLEFKRDLALWTGVVFLVLLALLWKFAWGPIARGLDKREQAVAEEIASAERANQEARNLLEQYRQKLAASRDEVRQMLDEARRDARKVGQQIVDKARGEAREEHQRALGEIELATDDALKDLARQSATLATDLAGKIVEARLDPSAHAELIEQAMAKLLKPGKN